MHKAGGDTRQVADSLMKTPPIELDSFISSFIITMTKLKRIYKFSHTITDFLNTLHKLYYTAFIAMTMCDTIILYQYQYSESQLSAKTVPVHD